LTLAVAGTTLPVVAGTSNGKRSSSGRRPKVLILAPFDTRYVDRLRESCKVSYESWIEEGRIQNPGKLAARLRQERVNALVVEADFLTADTFAVPTLRIAGVCRNALNLVDIPAATKRSIPIVHTPTRNAAAVAELAIGLMLALARRIPEAHAYVAARRWKDPIEPYVSLRGREIGGSSVGVIGLGKIGLEVARRATALGARVMAFDPMPNKRRADAAGVRLVPLERLLSEADFITLHTAQRPDTERMIDAGAIGLMKPGAHLVSTGAGNVIDEDALVRALKAGKLAGAALDVFPGHFISQDSPLFNCPNVILTPHIGGATPETVTRQSRMIVDDLERFFRGERPRRVVNPEALRLAGRAP
jgi:D-3-phosphoglycerate dehydrogenase